jgi:aspartate/methionine/tyrosine aminotransferase
MPKTQRPPRHAVRFPISTMATLVDTSVRFDLAESTCPPLRLEEIVDPGELAGLTLGYGTSRGDEELRELIGAEAGVRADQVLVTIGAMEALFLLAHDRGHGRAVLATPCFPPALTVPQGLSAGIDTVPLSFDDGYRLPVDAFAKAIGPDTTLVSVASPQNPSGVTLTEAELHDLLAVVEEQAAPDAVVLVDETYRESTYGDAPVPRSYAALGPQVVTTSSLSKAHGAPALRLGWLTTTDPELYERLRNAKFLTTVASPTVDQVLGAALLRRRAEVLAPRAALLRRMLDEVIGWAADQPLDLVIPDGGALCCLRTRSDVPDLHTRLAELDARVSPGSWFGEDDRVFRLGFGHLPPDDFTEALRRLGQALAS